MAFDEAKINVRSGNGGDGLISFRREKYIPRGGPSGGDGGRGGNVILRVNPKLNTLRVFEKKVHFKAKNGGRGGSSRKTGANGEDLYVDLPPGTVVRSADNDMVIADLIKPGDEVIIVKGGRGGRGNTRFTSSSNQAPRVAEKGEPGRERWIKLELKLIADVGIVGVPNAGKSTLLSVISNAKPRIAAYPFTTIEPNLGMVVYDDHDLVIADIPGLIEGAHMGIGLGYSFLRHVQRTRVLIHLLDGASEDVLADFSQINSELALYDDKLSDRPQLVIFNKMDLPEARERWPKVKAALEQFEIAPLAISAILQKNTKQLVQKIFELMSTLPDPPPEVVEVPMYEIEDNKAKFEILREDDGSYRVAGDHIERAAAMTYWDYEEAVIRFQQILQTLGITKALEEAGISVGDMVYIGDYELEWSD